jgi:hypothetical protein
VLACDLFVGAGVCAGLRPYPGCGQQVFQMRTKWPNPAAGKAGILRLLAIDYHCPGLPEPGR